MQRIKAGARRTAVVGLMNNFESMILKRLQLKKRNIEEHKQGVAMVNPEMTYETVKVTAEGIKNWRTCFMVCM